MDLTEKVKEKINHYFFECKLPQTLRKVYCNANYL